LLHPADHRLLRGGDRFFAVVTSAERDFRDRLFGGGIRNRKSFAVGSIAPLAVDEELAVGGRSSRGGHRGSSRCVDTGNVEGPHPRDKQRFWSNRRAVYGSTTAIRGLIDTEMISLPYVSIAGSLILKPLRMPACV
jgi:hypothetical protein